MAAITLLDAAGGTRTAPLPDTPSFGRPSRPISSRDVYAAAHVIPRWDADNTPGRPADIDWDATLAFRHHLWSWGLGVADAMDTAQRNMGLDPAATRELIVRSAAESRAVRGALVVGVNTDHLEDEQVSLAQVADAYKTQLHHAEDAGAGVVLMASRHLARAARSAADYAQVYRDVLAAAGRPVVLHWLGTAFDAALADYFGPAATAEDTVAAIIEESSDRVRGIKMSLLDAEAEVRVRRRLPDGVTLYTGDDFHYVDLIAGDALGHSDALLGAFAAIAPAASVALQALDRGDGTGFDRILRPTEALSRQVFAAPTQFYKTGVAFLAWLNGHQRAFQMIDGLQAGRSLPHLSRIVELAAGCGSLERPELARARWHAMLALHGVEVDGAVREPARLQTVGSR